MAFRKSNYSVYHILASVAILTASITFVVIAFTTNISYKVKIIGFVYHDRFFGKIVTDITVAPNFLAGEELNVYVPGDTISIKVTESNLVNNAIVVEGQVNGYSCEIPLPLEFYKTAPAEKSLGAIIVERVFKKLAKS